ncbi:BT_3987 domain-containing protein [Sphingobacterium sp. SYP-B4668]|uniref:BT_3987 domain-containing protein n=1 Tax=Sphingobacterium sp. SYP-B4668 TaxID=2996035 RepID=UPI0022DD32EF|nr:DUF1735 domain-containing protein [Sphingobacterium sp. SYP-B4668]
MKIHISYLTVLLLLLVSCKDDSLIVPDRADFGLSLTTVNFLSEAESKDVEVLNAGTGVQAEVISEATPWCTVKVSGNKVTVSVEDNLLVKSRNATVEVVSGDKRNSILIRQAGKKFTNIAGVQELTVEAGMGEVTLHWKEPTADNFSHVVVSYEKEGQVISTSLEPGVVEHRIVGLRNIDGVYDFHVQSVDKEGDLGEIVSISKQVEKLVAFGFSKLEVKNWLPYHFRTGENVRKTTLQITTNEFNADEQVSLSFSVDKQALDTYNQKNGTNHQLVSPSTATLPSSFVFAGKRNVEEMDVLLDFDELQDAKSYALPITIKTVSSGGISATHATVLLIYYVDDLSGWYTVERLASSGEGTGAYPKPESDRRRYIKRTGALTWETGYLFGSYSKSEQDVGGINTIQYIKLDPATKKIAIQQGNYAVAEQANLFDAGKNELTIKYLYRDWAGWWSHERMYNRSFSK